MWKNERFLWEKGAGDTRCGIFLKNIETCLLYTSDAADEL